MINYFKMPVGYLIPWDRQHNTTKVSLYENRKQSPAKITQEAAHSSGSLSPELWEWATHWHMKSALKPIGDPGIPYPCPTLKSVHPWILNPLEKQVCFWVAGRERLKSQTKLNTAVTKFKRLFQCSST